MIWKDKIVDSESVLSFGSVNKIQDNSQVSITYQYGFGHCVIIIKFVDNFR